MQKLLRILSAFLLFLLLAACSGSNKNAQSTGMSVGAEKASPKPSPIKSATLQMLSSEKIKVGDAIQLQYHIDYPVAFDSVQVRLAGTALKATLKDSVLSISTEDCLPGRRKINVTFYWGDSLQTVASQPVVLHSDITPQYYGYKIKKTFPHNTRYYTQGLEFDGDILYEGTGQTGQSVLSKLHLDKNELLQSINLPSEVFGEGITLLNDKVFQLTWQSNKGFVYEKESLRTLYEFSYPTEGWGLCNDGESLIMSDGSEKIYFLDTNYIQEVHRIQVYDDQGMVNYLNELEYIDGLIYANVYGTYNIVAFDPATGKVMKHINLKGILDKKDITGRVDVLNGIAYDQLNKRLIVTGKWWPKYYEIELIGK